MNILVLGATGQLGCHLQELLPSGTFWTRQDADLANPRVVGESIRKAQPDIVVNAAAYTAVDRAESESELARKVNSESPAHIARAAQTLDIPLIHVSTDYVFDGLADRPYRVADSACPRSVYGKTKLAGEQTVSSLCEKYWVLRTSWVFSEHGSNFVKTMLRLAGENEPLRVVGDQCGRPTYAGDLAELIAGLVKSETPPPWGIYHTGGGPQVSWYEFALEIFRQAYQLGLLEHVPDVSQISTAEYPTAAPRPQNSVLAISEDFQAKLGSQLDWKRGLVSMLTKLKDQAPTST